MPATDKVTQKKERSISSPVKPSKEELVTLNDIFDDTFSASGNDSDDLFDELDLEERGARFFCPNCGEIPRDEVLFVCNNCDSNEILYKDGVFVCPQCFYPGDNFECARCGNRKVVGEFSD